MPDNAALDMGPASRPQPALSATSDLPTIKAPVDTEDNGNNGEVVETTGKTGVDSAQAAPAKGENTDDSAASGDNDGADSAAIAKPPKGGFQKRIDELTKQREEFRREKEEYARRLDEALKLAQDRQPKERTTDQAHATDDTRPKREQFEDPDSYAEAIAEWSTKQAIKSYEAERAAKVEQEKQTGELQQVLTKWHEGRAKAIEKYPDFESVAEASDLPIPQHVGMAILNVPNGHDVMYHLGQHLEEAKRIAALGIPQAVLEIGRLSERLNGSSVTTSRAPAPPKPITGNRNGAEKIAPDDDPNYMENRLAEMRKPGTRNR